MTASPSKSSQKAKNVVITLLALWSIVSLIIIVVWATSPDLKGSAQCRTELQEANEKLEGAKVMFRKDKVALEELVEKEREEKECLRDEIILLLGRLNATNVTLEECRQENVVLYGNISVLQENIEQLRQTEANLTAQLRLQEEHIEELKQNVTETFHETLSCYSLKKAAESQMEAAQSQTKVCQSREEYLKKQLQKCKEAESETAQQSQQQDAAPPTPKPPHDGAASPLSGIPALTLLVCSALHLITCEYRRHPNASCSVFPNTPLMSRTRNHKRSFCTQTHHFNKSSQSDEATKYLEFSQEPNKNICSCFYENVENKFQISSLVVKHEK